MEPSKPDLTVLEKEIRLIVEANNELIQRIETLKKNQTKTIKIYNVVSFNKTSTIKEPLSIEHKEIKEEVSAADFINNWGAPFSIEKPEEIDPDKLLYGENKELMNMKCENYDDLVRINQQICVAIRYLTLLRKNVSLGFGLKFKKNFGLIGNLLKTIIRDIGVEELNVNDTKSNETITFDNYLKLPRI